MLKIETTARGFHIAEFTDSYGNKCSIQKSSSATKDCIWLGIDKPKLTVFENDSKGKYITTEMPSNFDVDSRMYLTIEQVKALLPILQNFVKTGELTK
jgi:hypothetical protein